MFELLCKHASRLARRDLSRCEWTLVRTPWVPLVSVTPFPSRLSSLVFPMTHFPYTCPVFCVDSCYGAAALVPNHRAGAKSEVTLLKLAAGR
eukprot:2789136-Prymnesium_polylepis.1